MSEYFSISSPVFLNARISWLSGIRSHALRVLLVLGGLLMGVAFLAGSFSLRQPLVVAMDVGLSGLRFLGLLLVLFWMQEAFGKDLERRTVMFAMAYPIPRAAYVIGRYLGVMALVFVTVAFWGALLYLINQFAAWGNEQSSANSFDAGYLLVLLGIFFDLAVIGSFFVAVSSVAQTPMVPFIASFFFALSARSIGVMIDFLTLSGQADAEIKSNLLPLLEATRWVLPDLSRLDWRQITLYGDWPSWGQVLVGMTLALGYLLVMLGCSVLIFRKRSFC